MTTGSRLAATDEAASAPIPPRPWTRTALRPLAVPLAVVAFALLTAVGGQIAVPLGATPVPVTLQTLFVLLAGVLLGPAAGASSQLLYLAMGLLGVPIFAMGGAGPAWLLGPTGGYLLAFPAAAALAGLVAGSARGGLRTGVALLLATALIFASGAAWLSVAAETAPGEVFALAVQPFLPGALLKGAIVWVATRPKVLGASRRGRR